MLDFNIYDLLVEANQIRQHIGIFAVDEEELLGFREQIVESCRRLNLGIWLTEDKHEIRMFRTTSLITLGLIANPNDEEKYINYRFDKVVISPKIHGKTRRYLQKRAR